MRLHLIIGCLFLPLSSYLLYASDPVSHETETRQARPRAIGEQFDSQENDPHLREAFAQADAAAERVVSGVRRDEHFIFRFWTEKKKILRQQHRIDWKTPAELNPTIAYGSYGQPRLTAAEIREITPVVQRKLSLQAEKIESMERTFDGTVHVWTRINHTEDRKEYIIQKKEHDWQIVSQHLVQP